MVLGQTLRETCTQANTIKNLNFFTFFFFFFGCVFWIFTHIKKCKKVRLKQPNNAYKEMHDAQMHEEFYKD